MTFQFAAGILGLHDQSYDVLYTKALKMFEDGLVSKTDRKRLRDAYADLHIKAVRRLILAGNIKPEDLRLGCHISSSDLYKIFPTSVINALYRKESGFNDFNYLNDYSHEYARMQFDNSTGMLYTKLQSDPAYVSCILFELGQFLGQCTLFFLGSTSYHSLPDLQKSVVTTDATGFF